MKGGGGGPPVGKRPPGARAGPAIEGIAVAIAGHLFPAGPGRVPASPALNMEVTASAKTAESATMAHCKICMAVPGNTAMLDPGMLIVKNCKAPVASVTDTAEAVASAMEVQTVLVVARV